MRKEERTMESVWQDLKYAVRVLARTPGFTLVAAVTLALGIGANGAIFSLVNGLLFRAPSGIEEPGRLVQIGRSYDQAPRWDNWSWPALQLIRNRSEVFSGVGGYSTAAFVLGTGPEAIQVAGQRVNGDFFGVLGVRPHLGRLLLPSDDVSPGAHPVVVLSHGLWSRRFGADPSIVGRTVQIGSAPYEVVGVAPPGFSGPEALGTPPALWVPTMQHPGYFGRLPFEEWGWSWIDGVGRLRDGATLEEARAAMEAVTAGLRQADPVNEDIRVLLAPGVGLDPGGRTEARQLSVLLLGVVGLVLLLACTNVANLFLARTTGRRGEVAVRVALGAGRSRVARQLVIESLVLAALATLLAVPIVRAAGAFLPALVPYALAVPVGADLRVYLVLGAVGLAAGLLFGAVPSWIAGGRNVADTLREGSTTGGAQRTRVRDALVVVQLAISLALVTGAALLGRSLSNARVAEPGFRPRGLTVAFVDLGSTGRYDADSGLDFVRGVLDDLEAAPEVGSVTVANQAPIVGGHSRATVRPEDRPDSEGFEAERIMVGPDYFETLGVSLVRGRTLDGLREPERSVVVNEALARMFWPDGDPLGQRLGAEGEAWTVVGVVDDVKMRSLQSDPNPAVYYPLARAWSPVLVLHARSAGTAELERTVRRVVADHDPGLPVAAVLDLREAVAASLGETRTLGYLSGAFAGLALALAAVGLYGLVSFGVSRRIREMGIRKALGARPEGIVLLVLRRGLGLAILGVVAGVAVSFITGQALEHLLFGVRPMDPATLAAGAAVLLGAGLLAAWIPARRASRVDAAVSLREQR
jgi:predicted permease